MIDIRPLNPNEIPMAKQLVPSGHAEPNWESCHAIVQNGEIVGLVGIEQRLVAEPLYVKHNNNAAALMAMGWIDGQMRAYAQGRKSYECFVGDDHPEFQKFIAQHLPMTEGREKPGKYFFRRF